MNILITGASGFIGSFLCEEALRRGYETWAGVRERSSRKYLQDERLQFAVLDMTNKQTLTKQLSRLNQKWDVIVHAGGATKCLTADEFRKNNFECTTNFIEVLQALNLMPQQFIYISSYSVIGNSQYGASKLMTEEWIEKQRDIPYVFFRPTGVYGPRERDYFIMAQSIKNHVDFAVGTNQQLTFIYVADLVGAVFAAIDKGVCRRTYNVADGNVYESSTFSDLIQKELGVRFVVHIKAPLWFLKVVTTLSDWWARNVTKRPTTLNKDKYHIMAQRDWTCDIIPLLTELDFKPEWNLERGVKETIRWYKENHWL